MKMSGKSLTMPMKGVIERDCDESMEVFVLQVNNLGQHVVNGAHLNAVE